MTSIRSAARPACDAGPPRRLGRGLAVIGLTAVTGALSPAVTPPARNRRRRDRPRPARPATDGGDSSVTQTHTWPDDEGTSRRHGHRLADQGPGDPPDRRHQLVRFCRRPIVHPGQTSTGPADPDRLRIPGRAARVPGRNAKTMTPGDCAITGPSRFLDYAINDANETDAVHARPGRLPVVHRDERKVDSARRDSWCSCPATSTTPTYRHQLVRDLDRSGRHP